MKLLFIHQNIPSQFEYLIAYLTKQKRHEIYAITSCSCPLTDISVVQYKIPAKNDNLNCHPYLHDMDLFVKRGQLVSDEIAKLKNNGFIPDVVYVHPGWGEGLFVQDVLPDTPIVMYCENYPNFAKVIPDAEIPEYTLDRKRLIRLFNSKTLISLPQATICVFPTRVQSEFFPQDFHHKRAIIHEGVNTDYMRKNTEVELVLRPLDNQGNSALHAVYDRKDEISIAALRQSNEGSQASRSLGISGNNTDGEVNTPLLRLNAAHKIVTYVSRSLEPQRGFHMFMRSLPTLQRLHPDAHILIVGGEQNTYSRALNGTTYKAKYLTELTGQLDFSHIHFLGRIPYPALRALFQIASAHTYLTHPFALSWSLMEAMACECLIVGSRTEPVEEVIIHNENGLLVDFLDAEALAITLGQVLDAPEKFASLRQAARKIIVENYAIPVCLEKHRNLLASVARVPLAEV